MTTFYTWRRDLPAGDGRRPSGQHCCPPLVQYIGHRPKTLARHSVIWLTLGHPCRAAGLFGSDRIAAGAAEWNASIGTLGDELSHLPLARLIVVETVRLARTEPLLPCAFDPDDVAGVHVRRDALKDTESEIPGITLSK